MLRRKDEKLKVALSNGDMLPFLAFLLTSSLTITFNFFKNSKIIMGGKMPILKGKKVKTRILSPSEFEMMSADAETTKNMMLLKGCLLLGARYEECRRVQELLPLTFTFLHLHAVM